VLAAHAPDLADELRNRLLAEAAGNPLALVESPTVLSAERVRDEASVPSPLPLGAMQQVHHPLAGLDLIRVQGSV
jgi:hypothetical protein